MINRAVKEEALRKEKPQGIDWLLYWSYLPLISFFALCMFFALTIGLAILDQIVGVGIFEHFELVFAGIEFVFSLVITLSFALWVYFIVHLSKNREIDKELKSRWRYYLIFTVLFMFIGNSGYYDSFFGEHGGNNAFIAFLRRTREKLLQNFLDRPS